MDGLQFDSIARSLGARRTRRAVTATLGAALGATALAGLDAEAKKKKKHKKPCAKKCSDGCCTGKKGKCIQPAQQSSGQCGTGGEICRSTGCLGTCPNCVCSASAPCPTGQCCRGDGTCGACLVFVSSSTQTGNLGGLAGADLTCQGLAKAAGLPGTYLTWLSVSNGASPTTRFTKATVPYTLVDGTVVAQNWAELTSGALKHAIDRTETGTVASTPLNVWTYTLPDGTGTLFSNAQCQNWTSTTQTPYGIVGALQTTNHQWTVADMPPPTCNTAQRLYCFQQS